MEGQELRALATGELLDRTISLFRSHFGLFVGIAALPAVLQTAGGVAVLGLQTFLMDSSGDDDMAAVALQLAWVSVLLVLSVLSLVLYLVSAAATALAVSHVYLDRPIGILDSYSRIRPNLGGLLLLGLLFMLIGGGTMVFVAVVATVLGIGVGLASPVAGMIVTIAVLILFGLLAFLVLVRLGVAVPALVLERLSATDALKRSVFLTKGHGFKVILIYLLVTVINIAAAVLFQGPFYLVGYLSAEGGQPPFWTQALATVGGGVTGLFTGPLFIIALTLLYYDMMIRKEAFDLSRLMSSLTETAPAAVSET